MCYDQITMIILDVLQAKAVVHDHTHMTSDVVEVLRCFLDCNIMWSSDELLQE